LVLTVQVLPPARRSFVGLAVSVVAAQRFTKLRY